MSAAYCYNFQTRLNEVIVYYSFEPIDKKYPRRENQFDLKDSAIKIYSGEMTVHAKRRIKRAIECLYMITHTRKIYNRVLRKWTNFRLSHLTLTLSAPQNDMSDSDIANKMLAPFLRSCKNKLGMKNYVWKAERQYNYNIHYHIISDMYADMNKIRHFWNAQQRKFHYINDFQKIHGHYNPPSTEIKYVRSDAELAAYLMKYISKQDNTFKAKTEFIKRANYYKSMHYDKNKIETLELEFSDKMRIKGKVWDSSKLLKSFKYFSTDLSYSEDLEFRNALKNCEHTQYNDEYFSIIKFKDRNYISQMPLTLREQYIAQFEAVASLDSSQQMQKTLNF